MCLNSEILPECPLDPTLNFCRVICLLSCEHQWQSISQMKKLYMHETIWKSNTWNVYPSKVQSLYILYSHHSDRNTSDISSYFCKTYSWLHTDRELSTAGMGECWNLLWKEMNLRQLRIEAWGQGNQEEEKDGWGRSLIHFLILVWSSVQPQLGWETSPPHRNLRSLVGDTIYLLWQKGQGPRDGKDRLVWKWAEDQKVESELGEKLITFLKNWKKVRFLSLVLCQ